MTAAAARERRAQEEAQEQCQKLPASRQSQSSPAPPTGSGFNVDGGMTRKMIYEE